jgi:hypothetical protein
MRAMLEGGLIPEERRASVEQIAAGFDADARRYEAEKRAILEGGTVDGASVDGARTWAERATRLGAIGDVLDVAMLLLHLALLLGGVGVAISHRGLERALLRIVVALAGTGVLVALSALVR